MRTKIVDGTFHFKKRGFIFLEGEIKPVKLVVGKLRVTEDGGTTYVVIPISDRQRYEGCMIPIIENYDSLEEEK